MLLKGAMSIRRSSLRIFVETAEQQPKKAMLSSSLMTWQINQLIYARYFNFFIITTYLCLVKVTHLKQQNFLLHDDRFQVKITLICGNNILLI